MDSPYIQIFKSKAKILYFWIKNPEHCRQGVIMMVFNSVVINLFVNRISYPQLKIPASWIILIMGIQSRFTTRNHVWRCQYLLLVVVTSYWKFTTKSPHIVSIFLQVKAMLLLVNKKVTWRCQYLFLDSQEVIQNSRVSWSQFNTQIIPHYKNTFKVWSAINQYQSIFCTNKLYIKIFYVCPINFRLQ